MPKLARMEKEELSQIVKSELPELRERLKLLQDAIEMISRSQDFNFSVLRDSKKIIKELPELKKSFEVIRNAMIRRGKTCLVEECKA